MVRVFIILILLLSAVYSYAEMYKWVDESGVMHFSDNPPPPPSGNYREERQNTNANKNLSIIQKIVGVWVSVSESFKGINKSINDGEMTWIINDDGTMIWLMPDGSKFTVKYSIESNNSPYAIDINNGSYILRTSFKLIDEQTMLIAMKEGLSSKDRERLSLTDPNVAQITFKRIDSGREANTDSKRTNTEFLRGIPAPYSNYAFEKINSAMKDFIPPKVNENLSKEERMRLQMKMVREGFNKAGYGFDDTLIKVIDDMRYHRDRIPRYPSVYALISFTLQGIVDNCKDGDFDCLQFFPPDSAEIIKSLIKGEFK